MRHKEFSVFDTAPMSVLAIFRVEWKIWLPGAILAYLLANVLVSGWDYWLIPDLSFPYASSNDGLFNALMIRRIMEGWINFSPRSGYPFGSELLDYPSSDSLNFLLLKLYGFVTGSFNGAMNLFIILAFPLSWMTAYLVMRTFSVGRSLAVMGAFLFAFMPFPFTRFNHILLLSYFVVPIYFYLGYKTVELAARATLAQTTLIPKLRSSVRRYLPYCACIILSSFGAYNAVFGAIVFAVAGILSVLLYRSLAGAQFALLLIVSVFAGILLNTAPNIVHRLQNGANPEVALRSPVEAELYGLKLIQMLYPRFQHRVPEMASISEDYEQNRPMVNENRSAALGVVGSIGFLALGGVIIMAVAGHAVDTRLSLLALVTFTLFLCGTIGGVGAIFADQISPLIRAWNRVSVFISFGSLTSFAILAERNLKRFLPAQWLGRGTAVFAVAIIAVGIADQTNSACMACNDALRSDFRREHSFIRSIEQALPAGSAVYQLPYMRFPEASTLVELESYGLAAGFVNSKRLRWSYGGMAGRRGDLFYRSLAEQPLERQLPVLKSLGFAGIYVDGRGYADGGKAIIDQLTSELETAPGFVSAEDKIYFFRLNSDPVDLAGLNARQIMERAGYVVDASGKYLPSLTEGIAFSQSSWPGFVTEIKGLSQAEAWGRWSDETLNATVEIGFATPLPTRFTLVLEANAFGPNARTATLIRIGDRQYEVSITEKMAVYRVPIDLGQQEASRIEIVPSAPVSPAELGMGADSRRLGVGLSKLGIEMNAPL